MNRYKESLEKKIQFKQLNNIAATIPEPLCEVKLEAHLIIHIQLVFNAINLLEKIIFIFT
jgi:hypothetical protein